MGLLAVAALALIVSQAIAGASNTNNASNAPANADNGGVMIIETYSASAVTVPEIIIPTAMQMLPGTIVICSRFPEIPALKLHR